jgi:biopolymer transport protein ExbD
MAKFKRTKKTNKVVKLNLVAIIDIFTILVFFLMVSSSGGEVLENTHNVKLPDSMSEVFPQVNLKILITGQQLLVNDQRIDMSSDAHSATDTLPSLQSILSRIASKHTERTAIERDKGLAVTIMGDAQVPYQLLKKVLATCAQSDFRNVSLAVNYQAAISSEK